MPRPEPFRAGTWSRSIRLGPPLWSLEQYFTAVSGNSGYEALRQLISLYAPESKSRSLGILTALTQVSSFKAGEALFPILELERVFTECENASQQLLQEELLRCLPAASRNQVHATLPEDASYSSARLCAAHRTAAVQVAGSFVLR